MKKAYKKTKTIFGFIFTFTICLFMLNVGTEVKASNTSNDITTNEENMYVEDIMNILRDESLADLKDGDSIVINNKYLVECEETTEMLSDIRTRVASHQQSKLFRISILGVMRDAVTITHTMYYTLYDNNLSVLITGSTTNVSTHMTALSYTIDKDTIINNVSAASTKVELRVFNSGNGEIYYIYINGMIAPIANTIKIDIFQL